jgi:dual specificity tyrosine-phosphorylation-regulated kinase 2/3/4
VTVWKPVEGPRLIPLPLHAAFIKANFEHLSRYERGEIVDFKEIFYSGTRHTKTAATPEVTANNHGYDDERGDYLVIPGDHLAYRYEIEGVLGKGSFGQVLQCRDHKTGQYVAIKIIRNKKRFHSQAQVEVKILQNLVAWVCAVHRSMFCR